MSIAIKETPMDKRFEVMIVVLFACVMSAEAQRLFPDGIALSNEYVRQQGLVDLQAWTGGAVTNEAVRGLGVSLGQMAGINPETGEAIADPTNLLPLAARSLNVFGTSQMGGALDMGGQAITSAVYYGNGTGITNLPAVSVVNIGTNYSLANMDCQVVSTNAYETLVSLPAAGAATVGRVYNIFNLGAGLLQVRANGSDKLNNSAGGALAIGQHGTLRIVGFSGTEWMANP